MAAADIDLFGSDDKVDVEKEEYAAKRAKKPGVIAKSSVILKPWDDETNLEESEKNVRSIEQDGLVWGGGKPIPLAYGIKNRCLQQDLDYFLCFVDIIVAINCSL
ncbi:hypothetical protein QR680_012760 [Steinernema hermaphroditum]|uniref:Translation elongation factor EF1B beta/delta subunit guanine nucleotide exchange domain-containing protein n=1 Tax=Steinernema hermaphroditum TaxID=289476 RepID=A0AA39I4G4_9BILA|nr:hypothetical protein QR680_012760 [Steinernema hermaphroditum]